MSIKIGTSNTDGSGSATNLDSSHEVLSTTDGSNSIVTDEYSASVDSTTNTISAESTAWNGTNTKEVKINAQNHDINVENFVDVDINANKSSDDINISIENAKRGEITTGNGSDNINLSVISNGSIEEWENSFLIKTRKGDDNIVLTDAENSENTSLVIKAGKGDDTIDLSAIVAGTEDVTRVVNAGKGHDTVIGSLSDDIINGGKGQDSVLAGDGNDIIYGGNSSDFINGQNGDDTINGGSGHDIIIGDSGDDILTGDKGCDTFSFDFSEGHADNIGRDIITDFNQQDTLEFSGIFGSDKVISSLNAFSEVYDIEVIDQGADSDLVINLGESSITLSNMGTDNNISSLTDLENAGFQINLVGSRNNDIESAGLPIDFV